MGTTGCKDAEVASDHMLVCQHIREHVLPRMELYKLFAPGQDCSVDSQATFNYPVLPSDEPRDFQLPGTPELSLSPALLAFILPPLTKLIPQTGVKAQGSPRLAAM